VLAVAGAYVMATLGLIALRWIDPVTTSVQVQRRMEALYSGETYRKDYRPVRLERISQPVQHAVIAAEDGRFFEHYGIDWLEIRKVMDDGAGRPLRGASTITQQLIKNLYFTTHRSMLRKAGEFALAPAAELILGKRRILELYLNVIEWGPGVFGVEAAAQRYYGIPAQRIGRGQAARLAAVIPAPARRRPERMGQYAAEIQARMTRMGW
jgi:monofunctional glycosyltransferase